MSLYLTLVAVAVLVTMWLRSMRRARREWIRSLDLIGQWDLDTSSELPEESVGEARSLTLSGGPVSGPYVARDGDMIYRGRWSLSGNRLSLEPEGGRAAHYDLRAFGAGRIGIDGPGRQREIYVKRDDNVIPFRVRS